MNEAAPKILELKNIVRTFGEGKRTLDVLRGANLDVHAGEVVALVGPSGAGKSTLLHIAGLLEAPSSGDVLIDGQSCIGLGDDDRTLVRRYNIGFVYQYHHLLPEFSALENIIIPQIVAGIDKSTAKSRAYELLEWMACRSAPITAQGNSPAANNNASPSPANSPHRRACCWPTSRPATLTLAPPMMCSMC